jgi:hypothetical protein
VLSCLPYPLVCAVCRNSSLAPFAVYGRSEILCDCESAVSAVRDFENVENVMGIIAGMVAASALIRGFGGMVGCV